MPTVLETVSNRAVLDVEEACKRSSACFVDRLSARKTQGLNPEDLQEEDLDDPQAGLADYMDEQGALRGDCLNVRWALAGRAASLESGEQHWARPAVKETYGTLGGMARADIHEDEEAFQREKRPDGTARLSNVPKPSITSCDKTLLGRFDCAQCGAHPSERPVVGVQMLDDIHQERLIKFVLFDGGEDKDREERSQVAADASVHAFIRQFCVGGAQAKETFHDLAYCGSRQCRMSAGVLRVPEQAMFLQTGQNPRFNANVRHGWKTSLLNNLCRLRLAFTDPKLSDDMRARYRTAMPALVKHVREHSYWMRNEEKQFVSTAVLLVIHCDAFGLCFGTDREKESFVHQMAEAPKAAFDELVTKHILSASWHGRTMDALKQNQRLRGAPGSGCKTWFHTLSDGILRTGWPTPMATAMVNRIVANFIALQCPFDGTRPLHQVRRREEMRFWSGNQEQNDLIKGPFAAAVGMVGKLSNGRAQPGGSSDVHKAVAAALKSTNAQHWMVKQLARVIGEPGRQDDALVRKSTIVEVEYSAVDNSAVTKQNLDMPAQLEAIVHGLRMREAAGTLIAKHLPKSVLTLAMEQGVTATDYFLDHLLAQLVFAPMPRASDGNLFVCPSIVETVEEIQGTLNPSRGAITKRASTASDLLGKVLEIVRRPWAKPQRKKVLGRVTKLGMFVRERQQMPELLRAHLDAQDAVAMQAALFAMKVLLYVLRGQRDSSGESEWVWGPELKTKAWWQEFPVLASAPDPNDLEALELLQTLDAAHAYFKELLEHHGPKPPAYYCHIHLMQPEHFLHKAAAIVEYSRAMVKACESRHHWIVPYTANYTRALVDAARHLEAALLETARPARVPTFMQAASIRIGPCPPASCPELQRQAGEQWVANWRRDLANGTVSCSLEEYLVRDVHTPVRFAEHASAQLFERFEALRLSDKLSGETFQQWKQQQQRIDEAGLPFTDERCPSDPELARRKAHAERVAASAQRRLTSRAMNEFSGKTKRDEKLKYKDTYLQEARALDEGLRAELWRFLSYKAPLYGPHPEQYTLYLDELHLRTGGAGRRHAQMLSTAGSGRRNGSKVGADNGTAARTRILQVWSKATPEARAAEREKLFDGLIFAFTNGEEKRAQDQDLAEAVRMAGLAKPKAATAGGDDADAEPEADALEAVEASPAKKAKFKTAHERLKDMKADAKAQQQEAQAHGFEKMHEGLRKVGPDGTVGQHTSMWGAYREHLEKHPGLSEEEKLLLMPVTMRPKGYRQPKAAKARKAPAPKARKAPAPTKRTRRGRRVVVESDSDSDSDSGPDSGSGSDSDSEPDSNDEADEADEPQIAELECAPVLDEEDAQATNGRDDYESNDDESDDETGTTAEGEDDAV